MQVIYLILYIIAAVMFAVSFFMPALTLKLAPAGLFAWVLVPLIHAIKSVH